jgi:hypothetical protein
MGGPPVGVVGPPPGLLAVRLLRRFLLGTVHRIARVALTARLRSDPRSRRAVVLAARRCARRRKRLRSHRRLPHRRVRSTAHRLLLLRLLPRR